VKADLEDEICGQIVIPVMEGPSFRGSFSPFQEEKERKRIIINRERARKSDKEKSG